MPNLLRELWVATIVAVLTAVPIGMVQASGYALVFAPGDYANLPSLPSHAHAADQLTHRLVMAGMPKEQVVLLKGRQATAQNFRDELTRITDAVSAKDLFLVVICSHGIQVDDQDYLCAYDTPAAAVAETKGTDLRLLSIRGTIEEITYSASLQRVLIADGFATLDGSLDDAALRFGRLPLKTVDGQWVIVNRSRQLVTREGQQQMTSFMWSLLDGLVVHADGNRDGSVSLLELLAYMNLYAEDRKESAPSFAGKTDGDLTLIPTTAHSDNRFPTTALNANAQRLVLEARKTLLVDMDVRAASQLLDRARRLAHGDEMESVIDDLVDTARILRGEADQVLPDQRIPDKSWTTVLTADAQVYVLYANGVTQSTITLPVGTVVKLTKKYSNVHASVVAAWKPQGSSRSIAFEPLVLKPGWISIKDLAMKTTPLVPRPGLMNRLSELDDVEDD